MRRELAQIRRLAALLIAVIALAGCGVLGVSTLSEGPSERVATALPVATAIPRPATATAAPVAVVPPSPVPPTPTLVPPTATPASEPTATMSPAPTATSEPPASRPAETPTVKAAKPTATKQPTSAASSTPRPAATKAPAPASGRVVGLDPGHHRLDIGARSASGILEYKLNMETALAVRQILIANGYTVRMSRWTDNPVSSWSASTSTERIRIEQQARIAAVGAVSAYVPIHFNATPLHIQKGTEAYYNASTPVGAKSKSLAQSLVSNVVSRIRAAGYPTVNRGAKSDLAAGKSYGHMFSLSGPYPSSLMESLFMDQPDDAAALAKPAIRAAIARGIADGIMAYLR